MSVSRMLTLSTGQTLGYFEMGNPEGEACFFFHGFPGSSRQILVIQHLEVFKKFRIIAIDRPGFGDSSYKSTRLNIEIVDLVQELAAHLEIEKFHLLGVSGGGAPAFLVADRLRSKTLSLNVISGLGPLAEREFLQLMTPITQWFLRIGKNFPFLAARVLDVAHAQVRSGRSMSRAKLLHWLPSEDVNILMQPSIRTVFRESMGHAFKQGGSGVALEIKIFHQDWGIQDWNFPFPVHLWHGLNDRVVPPEHSRKLAARIPHAELHLLENEGHYSLPILRIEEILAPLSRAHEQPSK